MRRQAFLKAVHTVVADLVDSNITSMYEEMFDRARKNDGDGAASAFSYRYFLDYSLRTARYSRAENELLEIMDLSGLRDPDWWQSLGELDAHDAYLMADRVRFAIVHLPLVASMLEREIVDQSEIANQELVASGMDTLSILLVEDKGQRSTPDRLILALQGVTEIYQAIATMEGEAHSDLSVLAIDSGSDKSFDFLGLAKVMAIAKETLIAVWDRRVFHRHMHVSMCIQTIAESLPVIQQIHDLKEAGALSPEQAELLKRQMISGTSKLLEVGAVTPEMEALPASTPRGLMRPEPKLLAAPSHDIRDSTFDSEPSEGEPDEPMSDEDIRKLETYLKAAKKKRK